MVDKLETLQVALLCDRHDGKKTIATPAFHSLLNETIKGAKRVLLIGGRPLHTIRSSRLIFEFNAMTNEWREWGQITEQAFPEEEFVKYAWGDILTTPLHDGTTLLILPNIVDFNTSLFIFDPRKPNERMQRAPVRFGPRTFACAVTLHDGRVMLMGTKALEFEGDSRLLSPTNIILDPTTWTTTLIRDGIRVTQNMFAVVLANGEVLITGGDDGDNGVTDLCRIYNPRTLRYRLVAAMNRRRRFHTGCLLPSGRVLVCGGTYTRPGILSLYAEMSEEYDPLSDTWTNIPRSLVRVMGTPCTMLFDGQILCMGSPSVDYDCQLYDPDTKKFTPGPRIPVANDPLKGYGIIPLYD